MGYIRQTIAQLRQLWGRLSRTQQLAVIGIAAGALVFSFIYLRMSGQQTYVVAYTNLDPKDSSAVADQLKANNIPYQVTPDGSTVKVPPANLADARLKLAAKGLPQGGAVGFELFDKTSFGVTDFQQNVNYQRALEGELTRTINTLSQVANSRVSIVVPQNQLFVQDQKPATASVLLQMRPGNTLDGGQLKGIAHLIARSVEGLDEKNITIVDDSGKLLWDGGATDDGVSGLTTTQIDMEHKVEQGIETNLQSLLDKVAGPNRSAVRVKADLDFSQQQTSSETFQPQANGQGVQRSSSSVTESFAGAGQGGSAGTAGAASNVPGVRAGATPAAGGSGNSAYQHTETTTNYEISRTTTQSTVPPGQIKRLSVSVLLDSSISADDAAALRDSLAAAAGIDQNRGDQIVVSTASFSAAQTNALPAPKTSLFDLIGKYAKVAVPVLVALIILIVIWRMSKSVGPARPGSALVLATQGALPAGAAAQAYALNAGGGENALPGADGQRMLNEPQIPPEQAEMTRRRNEVTERMTNLANANPEALVEIIHDWMSQDDRRRK